MVIITGVSRGFGKAIAEHYLATGEKVVGIGRSATIEHPNFRFVYCDLLDLNALKLLSIELLNEPITLINNAGMIGDILRISDKKSFDLDDVLTLNVTAPTLLMQKIYSQISDKNAFVQNRKMRKRNINKKILNISYFFTAI